MRCIERLGIQTILNNSFNGASFFNAKKNIFVTFYDIRRKPNTRMM